MPGIETLSVTATLKSGGARRDRTADLLRAKQALSQLSYGPLIVPSLQSAQQARIRSACAIADPAHGLVPCQEQGSCKLSGSGGSGKI